MEFEDFNTSVRRSESIEDKISVGACLLAMSAICGIVFVKDYGKMEIFTIGPVFGTASAVVLLAMGVFYRYAYRFTSDRFYKLLSYGWFFNAVYIFFETFIQPSKIELEFHLLIFVLGIVSSLPFYFSTFKPVDDNVDSSGLLLRSAVWGAVLSVWTLGTYLAARNELIILPPPTLFSVASLAGLVFSIKIFVDVGRAAGKRLDPEIARGWATVLPATFYVYAGLQGMYAFRSWLEGSSWLGLIFFVALLIKIVNSFAILKIIQLSTADVQKQLEQKSVLEDIGALTTSIEHDIRNPLQVIQSEFNSMKSKFQSNTGVINSVSRLEEQTKRIRAMADIIPILRGEKKFYDSFMAKLNIKDLINKSVKSVKKEMNVKDDIHFKVPNLQVFVRAYSPMMEQAIMNILRNAVEAIRERRVASGLVLVAFSYAIERERQFVRIDFADNGGGILESVIEDIFNIFMTTRPTKKPNSGIGLYIAKRILKVHGGRIEVANNEAPGATVSIYLPRWLDRN